MAEWWTFLTPPGTYTEEAFCFAQIMSSVAGPVHTLLELGSGVGGIAECWPDSCEITLLDLSPAMLNESQKRNPDCIHVLGDMRTHRLPQQFDAVLVHDAIMYMTDTAAVCAAIKTAADHLRPGGVLVLVPDVVKEDFQEHAITGGVDDERACRILEWHWDPNDADDWYNVEFCFLYKEGDRVKSLHETHRLGLFHSRDYIRAIQSAQLIPVEVDWDMVSVELPALFVARKSR